MSVQRAVKQHEQPAADTSGDGDLAEAAVRPQRLMGDLRPAADPVAAAREMAAAVGIAARPAGDGEEERNVRLFREDPRLDRRIIEGMLRDRTAFLEQMAAEGFAAGAVLRRAAELGLSEALIRQVKGVAADLAGERPGRRPAPSSLGARTCLSCDRIFLSSGPGNRLCMRCRGGDAGLAQL